MTKKLLGIDLNNETENDILEKIEKYIKNPKGVFHVVSVNPENMVIAHKSKVFKRIVNTAQIRIVDGFGIVAAGQILGKHVGPRLTGVDLMEKLLNIASERRIRVVLIGGKGNLAEDIANCYNRAQSEANFIGLQGIKDIRKPTAKEEKEVLSIVADYKPRLLFVAFGSPFQELWINKNRALLQGIVTMGVGGGFDFLSRRIRRAPKLLRVLGLEWLFRLILQPWRLKRQATRLSYFIWLVVKERFSKNY
ncbi:hypothetical protein A3G67_00890 [Candidatus Roizmanbacteria bacterium RIFCSPLOWO2_12_FULL_40_12]|nr:MAG: hypothetical protein A2779_02290 [Candidatus Roizmanbacteria bacterium RIFCSPHIGHO2_01_FULL_40_98]OGK28734.1 MAG: hypothetical protein A3C31_00970 [Candidatus Roizmanbacteria bacterium RIFCSPHIGHO2_02_FULL_40_53]OGK30034.1 MAG: hypothetical protein A2W49_01525 [Candidatus Roizmanbacteria bacterium RIFCSPHIGHO2_12_41_18]OGK36840.1 MAG: hypothetical protein A3E69_03910 [Candidatus Roizmanbacteria bacterium RIFCSPHIGHO2_12_FULL_40_130]OGK59808.1 MAG: hypothetical protein A3H84_03425 [Candi